MSPDWSLIKYLTQFNSSCPLAQWFFTTFAEIALLYWCKSDLQITIYVIYWHHNTMCAWPWTARSVFLHWWLCTTGMMTGLSTQTQHIVHKTITMCYFYLPDALVVFIWMLFQLLKVIYTVFTYQNLVCRSAYKRQPNCQLPTKPSLWLDCTYRHHCGWNSGND